jgi:hypothetical protein
VPTIIATRKMSEAMCERLKTQAGPAALPLNAYLLREFAKVAEWPTEADMTKSLRRLSRRRT